MEDRPTNRPRLAKARAPLSQRLAAAREAARRRVALRTVKPLTSSQRLLDPFEHGRRLVAAVRGGASFAGSSALHAATVALGLLANRNHEDDARSRLAHIEVHERTSAKPSQPPPPPKESPPPAAKATASALAKIAPPPAPPPPAPIRKPPARVIGLNLDSTIAGGDGPAFAAGTSLAGTTAHSAVDPVNLAPHDPGPTTDKPAAVETLPGTNRIATRLPTTGGKVILPKRKRPADLHYPETLKSQGIEAQVTVIIELSDTGKVLAVKIAKGADYPEFDAAARQAAATEEFEPATRDGKAMAYTLSYTYRFRLEEP